MRSLLTLIFLLILTLPVFAGLPFGEPFTLHVGESVQLGDNELTVGFDGILSDSRCPEGVWCFWEGDAASDLWLEAAGIDLQNFVLHTASSFAHTIEVEIYMITLLRVMPYPVIDVPIDPHTYVAQLVVVRDPVANVERSWGAAKAQYR